MSTPPVGVDGVSAPDTVTTTPTETSRPTATRRKRLFDHREAEEALHGEVDLRQALRVQASRSSRRRSVLRAISSRRLRSQTRQSPPSSASSVSITSAPSPPTGSEIVMTGGCDPASLPASRSAFCRCAHSPTLRLTISSC